MLRFHPVWSPGVDVTKVEVYRDGVLNYTTTNWTAGLRLQLLGRPDGAEQLITVRAYDSTGAWAEASTHVVVDQTPPTATISPVGDLGAVDDHLRHRRRPQIRLRPRHRPGRQHA